MTLLNRFLVIGVLTKFVFAFLLISPLHSTCSLSLSFLPVPCSRTELLHSAQSLAQIPSGLCHEAILVCSLHLCVSSYAAPSRT